MNILLVTSRVTYVKDNYYHMIKTVAERLEDHMAGILFIDNLDMEVFFKSFGIILMGAPRVGTTLLKNMMTCLLKKRDSHFKDVIYTKNINDKVTVEKLKKMNLDLIVNLRTRVIYSEEILSLPSNGCINIHHGILPAERGTMCDLWALFKNEPIGFSIHRMQKEIDSGKIILTQEVMAKGLKRYIDLPYLSSGFEAEALISVLEKFISGQKVPETENRREGSRYNRDPSFRQIRMLKKAGFLL